MRDPIHIYVDNGLEFCMSSRKKEDECNMVFVDLDVPLSAFLSGLNIFRQSSRTLTEKTTNAFSLSISYSKKNLYKYLHKTQQ